LGDIPEHWRSRLCSLLTLFCEGVQRSTYGAPASREHRGAVGDQYAFDWKIPQVLKGRGERRHVFGSGGRQHI
jgi:hypothetical protein